MATIALKLGPGAARDGHAVDPVEVGRIKPVSAAGSIHGLFVEIAVLNQMVPRQDGEEKVKHFIKSGGIPDMFRANPVKANVESIEIAARVHKR